MAAICGGNWNNSSNAGPFAMNLNNNRTNSNNNVGARDSGTKPETAMADTGARGVCCPAISEIKRDDRVSSSYAERHQVSRAPKREGRLFELTFTMDNLYEAYITARKGKRKKRATMRFESNLGAELQALYDELHDGTYMPRPYAQFEVYEPKKRVINAPAFRDLVVQHCIYAAIYDLFDRSFIATSYACRKGGGTHKASAYTQKAMRHYDGEDYYVKLDVKKFFYSIDRSILRALFEKKIKDKRFVDLMCAFAEMNDPKGIPIGNLLSQLYALIYMNPVDHYIKRDLKMKHYVRYVDDMVIIGVEKSKAKEIIGKVESFLKQYLRLEYSRWMMAKIKRGINFVGYRTWKSVKFVRKHSMYTFKMSLKKSKLESIVSLIGHAKKTATMTYYARLLLAEPEILNKLPQRSIACLNTTPTKK